VLAINVGLLREAQATIAAEGVTSARHPGDRPPLPRHDQLASMRIKAIVDALRLCPASSRFSPPLQCQDAAESKWDGLLGVPADPGSRAVAS